MLKLQRRQFKLRDFFCFSFIAAITVHQDAGTKTNIKAAASLQGCFQETHCHALSVTKISMKTM